MTLNGNQVLIMGGSSGIGKATAKEFAAAGADVVITGRDEKKLASATKDIGDDVGVDVVARRLDAMSTDELRDFFAEPTRYDHLVLAVSGSLGAGPIDELDLSVLRTGFDAKFLAQTQTLQAALPRLAATASITFITAASARSALPNTSGLAAINGALESMVPPLAVELAPIRVNAVSPGIVDTPWWNGVPAQQRDVIFREHAGTIPVGRVGRPSDIAQAVFSVATNGFITGTVLECTGGSHLATGR